MPVFAKDRTVPHDYFWWFHDGNRAIRIGDWKLVADHQKPWEPYDLNTDRSETKNLAASRPDQVKKPDQEWIQHVEEFTEIAKNDLPSGRTGANATPQPPKEARD